MTQLRDARLKKALDSAPDAQMTPQVPTRQSILAQARAAVAPEPEGLWHRLWSGSGGQRMPWNAAFVTLAIASVVTLLWHDREVPDARTEADQAASRQPQPSAAGPTPRASAPMVTATAPPAPPAPPTPATPAARVAPPAPAASPLAAAKASRPDAQATAELSKGTQDVARPAEPAVQAPRERRAETEPLRDQAAGASMAAPAPAAPSAPSMSRSAAPAARMSVPLAATAVDGATHLRVTLDGRVVEAPVERRSRLAQLLARAVREARGAEPFDESADTRIELRRDGVVLGVLELAGAHWKWTASGASAAVGRQDDALMQALREELGRLPR